MGKVGKYHPSASGWSDYARKKNTVVNPKKIDPLPKEKWYQDYIPNSGPISEKKEFYRVIGDDLKRLKIEMKVAGLEVSTYHDDLFVKINPLIVPELLDKFEGLKLVKDVQLRPVTIHIYDQMVLRKAKELGKTFEDVFLESLPKECKILSGDYRKIKAVAPLGCIDSLWENPFIESVR
jgi:hypothetical protein